MDVKRAMLVCRVVAGRMGSDQEDVDKEDGGFDTIVGRTAIGRADEELLVFNPLTGFRACWLVGGLIYWS